MERGLAPGKGGIAARARARIVTSRAAGFAGERGSERSVAQIHDMAQGGLTHESDE